MHHSLMARLSEEILKYLVRRNSRRWSKTMTFALAICISNKGRSTVDLGRFLAHKRTMMANTKVYA